MQVKQMKGKEELYNARKNLFFALLWRVPVILVISYVVFYFASIILAKLQIENLFDFIIAIGTFLGIGYRFVKDPIRKYYELRKKCPGNDDKG